MSATERSSALAEVDALAARFRAAGVSTKVQLSDPALVSTLQRFAQERAKSGDLLTQITRLPDHYRVPAITCLFAKAPYEDEGAAIVCTLKNVSDHPLQIEVGLDVIKGQRQDREGRWTDSDNWHGKEKYRMLGKGEEIDLSGHFATLALRRYSRGAFSPALWDASSAIPETDELIEVGFKCLRWGEEFSGRLKEEKRKEKAA